VRQEITLPLYWAITMKSLFEKQRDELPRKNQEVPGILWNTIAVLEEKIEEVPGD
jgi:hypothetical protein